MEEIKYLKALKDEDLSTISSFSEGKVAEIIRHTNKNPKEDKKMEELKPCECGGTPIIKSRYLKGVANRQNYWCLCEKCGYRTQERNRIIKAIDEWNRRKDDEN